MHQDYVIKEIGFKNINGKNMNKTLELISAVILMVFCFFFYDEDYLQSIIFLQTESFSTCFGVSSI